MDRDIAKEAAAILGTTTLRETIDASLREVVHAKRRLEAPLTDPEKPGQGAVWGFTHDRQV